MNKVCFIIIGYILFWNFCQAQEFPYYIYTSKDNGLPQTQVMTVKEAGDGCIWVGTYGGVGCFDGKRFRNFTEEDGLLSNIVYDLTIYHDTVFVLTRDGINLIVNNKVSTYYFSESVKFLFGKIFVNNNVKLAWRNSFDNKTDTMFDLKSKSNSKLFPSICYRSEYTQFVFADNSIFFTTENNLYEVDYNTGSVIHRRTFPDPIFKMYLTANQLYLLTGCKNGVISERAKFWHMDLKVGTYEQIPIMFNLKDEKLRSTLINMFIPVSDNKVMILTADGYIFLIDKTRTHRYYMNFNQFHSAYTDRHGLIWVGSEKGLVKIIPKGFLIYSQEQGCPENVWSVNADKGGMIMLASYNQGFYTVIGTQISKINISPKYNAFYNGSCTGFRNDYLFPMMRGVGSFNPVTRSMTIIKDKLQNPNMTLVKDIYHNRVLIGSYRTLISMDEQYHTDTVVALKKLGIISTILSIAPGKDKIIMGLARGLIEYNLAQGTSRMLADPKARYNSITIDASGTLWAATSKGIMYLKEDNMSFIQGVLNKEEMTSCIISDDNRLFVAGTRTLYVVDLTAFYQNKPCLYSYCTSNGYLGGEAQQNAFVKDHQGNLWIPTFTNVVCINPSELFPCTIPSMTKILSVESADMDMNFVPLDKTRIRSIPYKGNTIKITFRSVNNSDPLRMMYHYSLNSGSIKWEGEQSESDIVFNNLPFGKYIFKVRSESPNEIETDQWSVITFTIDPPFWNTWWFICLVVLSLLAMILVLINLFRKRERKKQRRKLEFAKLRGVALSHQIDHHFFANCNAKINTLYESGRTTEAHEYSTHFSTFLKNNLLTLRQDRIPLENELLLLKEYIQLEQLHGKEFLFEMHIENGIDARSIMLPPLLIQPVVENAIKYGITGNNGIRQKITLSVIKRDKALKIIVEDNGHGLLTSSSANPKGHGVGLKILKEQLILIGKGSDLKFDQLETGTRVTLSLKIL